MDTLYMVLPAYNEEANIEAVVRSWMPVLENGSDQSRMVIADSGSTDDTHQVLLRLCEEFPKLCILENTRKEHGPKIIALYKYAARNGADYIFQTDSDGQTDPSDFQAFWERREDCDAVIGFRPVRGDGRARAMVEKVVCFLVFLFFGVRVPDANAPFRLMRAEKTAEYLPRLPEDYALPNIMMTVFFVYFKNRVTFLPVSFQKRNKGVNSINLPRIIKIGLKALSDFASFRKALR